MSANRLSGYVDHIYQFVPSSPKRKMVMPSSADLGSRLETYVESLVKTGRYRSRSEVLGEGMRLVEEREKRLAALDSAIARGLADADPGHVRPLSEISGRLAAKYRTMTDDRDA